MKLLSVNVSQPQTIEHNGGTKTTGICKQPVAGPVEVGELGLAGDTQVDRRYHGGVDKAVYAYSQADYDWWTSQLPEHELLPGTFGENLTLEGLTGDLVQIGDRFRIGTVLVEVTQPRQPCVTLGMRMGMLKFVKQFHLAQRPGFYLRVLEPGTLAAGDQVVCEHPAENSITVCDVYRLRFDQAASPQALRHAAEIPALSDAWREVFRELLEAATS